MDLADENLADEFLLIACNNCDDDMEEVTDQNNSASNASAKEKKPLTTKEINQLLHRAPFKKIELTAQMSTLSKDEIDKITKSKRGDEQCQKNVHENAKLFFKTTMIDPAFKHYLDYVVEKRNKQKIFLCVISVEVNQMINSTN